MSSSPTKYPHCHKKISHIIPKEWNAYPSGTLDCVVYTGLKEHYKSYKTAEGASVTIDGMSTKAVPYKDCVWMRKDVDLSRKPSSAGYTLVYIDNYKCNHK